MEERKVVRGAGGVIIKGNSVLSLFLEKTLLHLIDFGLILEGRLKKENLLKRLQ